jgi:hypothetical protein
MRLKEVLDWYVVMMQKYWIRIEPDLVSVIAASRGWLPLEVDEKMRVTFGNKKYTIERTK